MAVICLGIIHKPSIKAWFQTSTRDHHYKHPVAQQTRMTKKKTPKTQTALPVIYVHAKDHGQVSKAQVQVLAQLGLPLCSRLEIEATTQTINGYDQPVLLLGELAGLFPGQPVIFMRAGLQLSSFLVDQLTRILAQADEPTVLSLLSNANTTVNPFAGLHAPSQFSEKDLASLVNLLAPGYLHTLTQWVDHFVFFSASAVESISAQTKQGSPIQLLSAADVKLQVPDHLFIHDPDRKVFEPIILQPHESLSPPPYGELSARLQDWFNAEARTLPAIYAKDKPATLHITHSWGGGVSQWLKWFIEADNRRVHFQLRSETAQSGQLFGQKLSLYASNELRCPVASWWLQPPIESVTDSASDYRKILAEICSRYKISRVFISSLIGHSLDALRTGLPTLHILHDHFPVWPLLNVNPAPYLLPEGGMNLERALTDHHENRTFFDKDFSAWSDTQAAYLQSITKFGVKIAAPGQWVIDLQNKLFPEFSNLNSTVIPHGFPKLANQNPVLPRPRKDGRLRMVILGRMQEGKGHGLLSAALSQLTEHVQIYLLGTGKKGEAYFGRAGVDVILDYDREELGNLLAAIGPDFAALLSVVPETFSYTLSELQQLGIPTIATRVGSFPDRISHGRTGWLIDVNPGAVIDQVAELCQNPDSLTAVRENLPRRSATTLRDMVKAYNECCPAAKNIQPFSPVETRSLDVQWAAADYQRSMTGNELRLSKNEKKELTQELKIRTQWAQKVSDNLKLEQKNRQIWITELQTEIDRLTKEFESKSAWAQKADEMLELERSRGEQLAKDVEERTAWAQQVSHELEQEQKRREQWVEQLETEISKLRQMLDENKSKLEDKRARLIQLESDFEALRAEHALILQSSSWRITRPLRAARRLGRNFMQARAWNPLRWPWIVSNLVRNLRTQGLSGTLHRLQYNGTEAISKPRAEFNQEPAGNMPISEYFPSFEQPDVSIVIPVFNKWEYTAACLRSLQEVKGKYSFEVIVVDDQSSDETADQMAQARGLQYLRNEQNLGFVGSCNRGASHARGEFIVLLNNDTQVVEGWLDELIDTFEREPEAGLVGARLVYPDGTLQESGGIIFSDGSGWNYGRGDDAEKPEYHFLREVDYCSGACIALRTGFFHKIGGLDERYAPAYYEDTDLAFKVRESGHKVMVQPASVVIHHEGITSGTDTAGGTKKFQLVNQQKFLDRWQSELVSQPQAITNPDDGGVVRKASQHRIKGRILFIDATTPEPDQDSGSVRLTNLLHICRDLGYGVTFFADNRAYTGRYTQALQKAGIEVLYHPWLDSLHDFFSARGAEYDYVFISRHYIATNYVSLLKRYCPNAHFIFDTVDLHYLREQRLAELEKSKALMATAQQTRRSELSVIKAADATLVVSSVEKGVLAEDAPGELVHILSNIHHVPGRDKGFAERKDIYFVGGYQHPPNIDAAVWFVNDVWPLIHEQIPEMRFHLIGSKAPEQVRSLEGDGVVFHGFVESLQPFLSDCRIAVAPLRYGAGVKGKVNMSMAHGQPMVVTSVAGEGMFAEHEREFLLAEDTESFAREVVRLYQDETLWYELSEASIKNVETHFSINAARDSILSLFETLSS